MLIGSVNYNNGLGYALTFLLGSLALVSVLHTYRNLAGLRVVPGAARPAFAGEHVRFEMSLDNRDGGARHGLVVRHGAAARERSQRVDVATGEVRRVDLAIHAPQRGWLALGSVTLATRFPFGLFRAWSTPALDMHALVYPRPAGTRPLPDSAAETSREGGRRGLGREDFAGLRPYRSGDSPRRIHWKAVARGQEVPVKLFSGASAADLQLRWEDTVGHREERLSQLCRWVLDADLAGHRYGLDLPGVRRAPDSGPAHRDACLRALALFELPAAGAPAA